MNLQEVEQKTLDFITESIQGFELVSKQKSLLMKFVALVIRPFNSKFSESYTTTIYPKIYVPDLPWTTSIAKRIEVLWHEYIHLRDREKMGWLFYVVYGSPQIFCLLGLLGFLNPLFFLFLLFILPWPSPGRMWLEMRGYRMSIAVQYWLTGEVTDETINRIVEQFVSSSYYFMMPLRKFVKNWFQRELQKIIREDLSFELLVAKSVLFPSTK